MNKHYRRGAIVLGLCALCCCLPSILFAQETSWAEDIKSLHSVLDKMYADMLPRCSQLIGVGRALAGFAALWYIAARVWGHIARNESIDFYPLFRPFVIGFAILIFPAVLNMMNAVLSPTVIGTSGMVAKSDAAIGQLLKQKQDAVKRSPFYEMYVGRTLGGDRDKWYRYTHPDADPKDEGWLEGIGNDFKFSLSKANYNFKQTIKAAIAEILEFIFAAASLAINTLRTFRLIILAMLGPIVFGLSVFDGFHHTLRHWIARYINVYLWLPVANIFGAILGLIQENMLKIDIAQVNDYGDTFFSKADMGYLIFMLIGILGYFTVPSIANEIVWVGGSEAVNNKVTKAAAGVVQATGTAAAGML